jgi:ribonuclease PH|eukprot:gene5923-4255_t
MIRRDLRGLKQTREVAIALGGVDQADGAAKVSFGQTSVSVTVAGPALPKYSRHEESDRCHLEVEILPSSAHDMTYLPTADNFLVTEFVRRALSTCIPLEQYPRQCISIKVLVLQNDGSLAATVLNAAMLALLDASIPLRHYLAAVQLVTVPDLQHTDNSHILLDPTLAEEHMAAVKFFAAFVADATLEKPAWGKVVAEEIRGEVGLEEYHTILQEAQTLAQALSRTFHDAVASKFR